MANKNVRNPTADKDQQQQGQGASGDWMDEDSTTGDGHPPRDRSRFRQDWQQNYSGMGGTYDDYAPAYDYGSSMGSRDDLRGRQWDDIETEVRTGWETDRPGTWDRFKDAIRHAWDQITGSNDTSRQRH